MAAVGTGVPSSAGSASSNAASGAGASLLSEVKRLSPRFTSPHDAVVFALHASLLQRGFKCVAFDEKAEPSGQSRSFCAVSGSSNEVVLAVRSTHL